MKALFATKGLEKSSGGSERVFVEICNEIFKNNNTISVLSFDKLEYESFYFLNQEIKKISLNHGGIFRHATIFSFFKSIYLLRKALVKNKPDVIVAFMHSMYVPIAFASLFLDIKIIASEHATIEYYNKKKLELFLIRLVTPFLSKIVFLSRRIAADYPKSMQAKAFFISNPVNNNYQSHLPKSVAKDDIILSVGRFDNNKRHRLLIEAFMSISGKYPQWRLVILGDGLLRSDAIKFVNNKSMSDRISLPGVVEDIESYYSKSSIFVSASLQESFGMSIAEAMLFECASICFLSSYGAQDLLHDGENGILIKASTNDECGSLSKAIEELICDSQLRVKYGKQARKFIIKNYKTSEIVNKWKNFLEL